MDCHQRHNNVVELLEIVDGEKQVKKNKRIYIICTK